jgi:transcriptional regulator with GAF, ATPase, and Fis domain
MSATHPPSVVQQRVRDFKRDLLTRTIATCNGNISAAARALQMDRRNFYRLAKRLGVVLSRRGAE